MQTTNKGITELFENAKKSGQKEKEEWNDEEEEPMKKEKNL